jgi:hypothetical protein
MAFVYLVAGSVWIVLWARAHQHSHKIHVVIGSVSLAGWYLNYLSTLHFIDPCDSGAFWNTLMFVELTTINDSGNGCEDPMFTLHFTPQYFVLSCNSARSSLVQPSPFCAPNGSHTIAPYYCGNWIWDQSVSALFLKDMFLINQWYWLWFKSICKVLIMQRFFFKLRGRAILNCLGV